LLKIKPISLKEANQYIADKHRHHKPVVGWKYGAAAADETGEIVGVVVVGRPVARGADNGKTLEVTRLCTDGTQNACSKLYGVARRVAFELGYEKIITYTLTTEEGASLRAAGWKLEDVTAGGSWNCASRPRVDKAPTIPKYRWSSINGNS
jgi:hypothetical protein